MKLISDSYKKDNEQLHHDCADYGGGGSRRIKQVQEIIERIRPESVLDYGSGKGDLTNKLREIYKTDLEVTEYDPCVEGKTEITKDKFDFVICNDVMEHVEIGFLWKVLAHLQELTTDTCFFCIALHEANKILPDGRNTHITLLSKEVWKVEITKYFVIDDYYMIGSGKLCLICSPKD